MYQSTSGDLAAYAAFVRNAVARYEAITLTVQIAEEPNVTGNPTLDGNYPDVRRAIVAGVQSARHEARRLGFKHLRIGTNTLQRIRKSWTIFLSRSTHELKVLGEAAKLAGLFREAAA